MNHTEPMSPLVESGKALGMVHVTRHIIPIPLYYCTRDTGGSGQETGIWTRAQRR